MVPRDFGKRRLAQREQGFDFTFRVRDIARILAGAAKEVGTIGHAVANFDLLCSFLPTHRIPRRQGAIAAAGLSVTDKLAAWQLKNHCRPMRYTGQQWLKVIEFTG